MKKIRVLSSIALALLTTVSCSEGNPVAPNGTILSVSASPVRIDLDGTSVITVFGRKPDGNPISSGTEIRLTTTLGSIPSLVLADSRGEATALLVADGRRGAATVTATIGSTPTPSSGGTGGGNMGGGDGGGTTSTSSADGSTTVDIGGRDAGADPELQPTLLLSVNPDNIPVGGTATVTVIGRNFDNTPVAANELVILTTTLGSLSPSSPRTDSNGRTEATLRAGDQAGTADIVAILGTSEPATTMLTIRDAAAVISLQPSPASIPRTGGTSELRATVLNAQNLPLQGAAVTFETDLGTFSAAGAVITNASGLAVNTLTVTEEEITNFPRAQIAVSAGTRGPDIDLEDEAVIRLE